MEGIFVQSYQLSSFDDVDSFEPNQFSSLNEKLNWKVKSNGEADKVKIYPRLPVAENPKTICWIIDMSILRTHERKLSILVTGADNTLSIKKRTIKLKS